MNNNKTLFKTCVGSHIWKMNQPDSDIDIFKCYIAPSKEFLIGRKHEGSHFSEVDNVDTTSTEVGVVVNQLLKNNINYLINVRSPIVIQDSEELQQLRNLTLLNLSKLSYNSIHGLALGNYIKYIKSGKQNTMKKRGIVARTLLFGINLLSTGTIRFEPIIDNISKSDIEELLDSLDYALVDSDLPEKPQYEDEMYDWLLKLRIANLNELCG